MLYLGVNLDFMLILLMLLNTYKFKNVLIGYLSGMLLVFLISVVAGQAIQSLIPEWCIGFLGLIPIIMAIKGEGDNEEQHKSTTKEVMSVLLIYLTSCGADNIAVYVPVLATIPAQSIALIALYFVVLTIIILIAINFIKEYAPVKKMLNRWGEPLTRLIYFAIGLFVMIDTGLFTELFKLLHLQ